MRLHHHHLLLPLLVASLSPASVAAADDAAVQFPWGYRATTPGRVGPADWHRASAECAGTRQSPVSLWTHRAARRSGGVAKLWVPTRAEGAASLRHEDGMVVLDLRDRGAVFTLSTLPDNYLLREVRTHTPAEHRLDNRRFQAEAHFVFDPVDAADLPTAQRAREPTLIVAVLFDETATGPGFGIVKDIMERAPSVRAVGSSVSLPWNATHGTDLLMPSGLHRRDWLQLSDEDYYEYDGSLTYPPCTETVRWMVSTKPRPITSQQLAALEDTVDVVTGNARPVSSINGREVAARRYTTGIGKHHHSEFVELPLVEAEFNREQELLMELPVVPLQVGGGDDDAIGGMFANATRHLNTKKNRRDETQRKKPTQKNTTGLVAVIFILTAAIIATLVATVIAVMMVFSIYLFFHSFFFYASSHSLFLIV